jgi:hypothetical protein
MADSIIVRVDPAQLQIKAGEAKTAAITVRNRSEEVAQYWLKTGDGQPAWVEFVPDQVSAFPLEETRAQINLHPPAETPGATYHITVRAVSQSNPALEGQVNLDVLVDPAVQKVAPPPTEGVAPRVVDRAPQTASQIQVKAELVKDTKLPPPATQWRLSLHNAGNVLDTFSFSTMHISPEWVTVDPTELTLNPGEDGSALVTVAPRDNPSAGTYPFTLRTYSHLNLSQRTELQLKVEIRPSAGFKLTVFPREAESQGPREFKITLASDASSNTDVSVDLAASDQDNACAYTFEPSQVFLPARGSVTSTLRVQPRGAVLGPNERRVYTLKVVATPRDGLAGAQSDEARLIQTGVTPLSLALRPQVQSADLEASYTLTVTNPASVDAALVFSADDPESACDFIFQPSKLQVTPRGEAQARLRVRARSYNEGDDPKKITFTATATRDGDLVPAAKADGVLNLQKISPVALQLLPPQQSQPGHARFQIKANNPRPTQARLWLEAYDESDALTFSFAPNMVGLSPGAEGSSVLNVRPKDKLMPGEQRRVHKFTVSGSVEGSNKTVTAAGVLAQVRGIEWPDFVVPTARIGVWALKWLVAAGLGLLLLTVAWAAVQELGCRSPAINTFANFLQSSAVSGVVQGNPFWPPTRAFISAFVDAFGQLVKLSARVSSLHDAACP